jgi:hypothetical protein
MLRNSTVLTSAEYNRPEAEDSESEKRLPSNERWHCRAGFAYRKTSTGAFGGWGQRY